MHIHNQPLAEARIYFGHQSVGGDIIDGIREPDRNGETPRLNIVEGHDSALLTQPAFAHSRIGRNAYPHEKIDDFAALITNGVGDLADVALMKLCYIDINENTDINTLFNHYTETLNTLQNSYPDTLFAHCTVPLTTVTSGPKTQIKKLLRMKHIWEYADNIARNRYNTLLLEYYSGKAPVFDLAGAEARLENDSLLTFSHRGKRFLSLNPALARDHGHLNDTGKSRVARGFLSFISGLAGRKTLSG